MRKKVDIRTKVEKEFPDFAEEASSLSEDALRKILASLAEQGDNVDESKENDKELDDAVEAAKEKSAPYRDAKRAIKLKTRYIVSILKEGANNE